MWPGFEAVENPPFPTAAVSGGSGPSAGERLCGTMDYNLGNKKGCLIGNWQEENALKDYCGHYRTAGPEEPK